MLLFNRHVSSLATKPMSFLLPLERGCGAKYLRAASGVPKWVILRYFGDH